MIHKKNSFSLLEISIVLIILSTLFFVLYVGKRIRDSSKLANAINMTAHANFLNNDYLVLWLETSVISKEKRDGENVLSWRDSSKNGLNFISKINPPLFKESEEFIGMKSIYFDGSNRLESENALNLTEYTAFIVVKSDNANSGIIYDTGLNASGNEALDNKIVIFKNNGNNKYIKKNLKQNFEKITNSDSLNDRPQKFYIGNNALNENGYKGELLELIIFDKVLEDKEITNIEIYLNKKYMR